MESNICLGGCYECVCDCVCVLSAILRRCLHLLNIALFRVALMKTVQVLHAVLCCDLYLMQTGTSALNKWQLPRRLTSQLT